MKVDGQAALPTQALRVVNMPQYSVTPKKTFGSLGLLRTRKRGYRQCIRNDRIDGSADNAREASFLSASVLSAPKTLPEGSVVVFYGL